MKRAARRRAPRILTAVIAVLLVITLAFLVWAHQVMPGERGPALAVWSDAAVRIVDAGDSVVMTPTGTGGGNPANGVGIVFIPGAKVDPYAYLTSFGPLVSGGTTVVITKPTLNLAFFDTRPLSTFEAHAPDVTTWVVGGHSLGGVRACQLAASDESKPAGLLLFGSYCANDLSSTKLPVLSLGGSEDGLSTPAKINAARHELPASAQLVQIPGASHASFGAYGRQPGDGTPTISRVDMIRAITQSVSLWLGDDVAPQ